MAKVTKTSSVSYHKKNHVKHPRIHSKNRHSSHKGSKHYQKLYRGQGR